MMQEWIVYGVVFAALLVMDFVLTRGREISLKRSLSLTGFYIGVAMGFGLYLYFDMGIEKAAQFTTIYWLEKLLSIDNLLVISLIFAYFGITKVKQHTALFYGIMGAVFFRTLFIFSGAALLEQWHWVIYIFAAFLIYSGAQIALGDDDAFNPEEKALVRFLKNKVGKSSIFLAAILAIEVSDIMFAVDSIPASFSVSNDKFIILTANLFAVLGLRSLYHAMAAGLEAFSGMEKYIGAALVFLGLEVFAGYFMEVPSYVTMIAVFSVIAFGFYKNRPGVEK